MFGQCIQAGCGTKEKNKEDKYEPHCWAQALIVLVATMPSHCPWLALYKSTGWHLSHSSLGNRGASKPPHLHTQVMEGEFRVRMLGADNFTIVVVFVMSSTLGEIKTTLEDRRQTSSKTLEHQLQQTYQICRFPRQASHEQQYGPVVEGRNSGEANNDNALAKLLTVLSRTV